MAIPRAGKVAPLAALAIIVGLVYAPLFLGQVLYQRDIGLQIYPERTFLSGSIATGESPMWNPLIGLGISTLANPLNQIFYPANIVLLAGHSPRATSFFIFAHVLFGAIGMMVLARRLTKGAALPGLVAGLAWGLSGYTTSEVTAGLRSMAGAYFPWCALGVLGLSRAIRESKSPRACVRAVALAALPFGLCFLTGEVFFPFLAAIFSLAVVGGESLDAIAPFPVSLRAWALRFGAGISTAAVLAVALGAAVLLPAQQAASVTARAAPLARAAAEVGSFHPWRMAELIAPGAMGDPYTRYPAGAWVGEPSLGQRPLLYGCYLGSSVLVLACFAFGRKRRLATALFVLAGLALLTALGRHTGVHAVMRALVPPLAYMRGPEKYLSLLVACLSLLAGLGTARLLEGKPRLWPRGGLLVAALVVLWLASSRFPAAMVEQVRTSVLVGLAFALAATAAAWGAGRSARWVGASLVVIVLVDLALAVFPLQNFGPSELLAAAPAAATAVLTDARSRGAVAPPRVYRSENVDDAIAAAAPPTSVAQVQYNLVRTLIGNHAGSFGIATVPGYDAAMPATLSTLWLGGRAAGLDLLGLTGVEYAVLPAKTAARPDLFPMMEPAPGTRLFRVQSALPRVYLAQARSTLSDIFARQAVLAPEVVAGRQVILASEPVPPSTVPIGEPLVKNAGRCTLTAFSHARIEADCEVAAPALAVFIEQFDRGWSATVDGQAAALLRANLTMRAVPVPAGRHHVVLSFSPPGLGAGLAVSLSGLLAVALLFFLGRRKLSRSL